jgi:hypothetical protein
VGQFVRGISVVAPNSSSSHSSIDERYAKMVPEAEEWYGELYPCEPTECRAHELSVKIGWSSRMALTAGEGMLIVDTESTHFIQDDNPDLVIFAIHRVLSSIGRRP